MVHVHDKMAALSGVLAGLAEKLKFKDDGVETDSSKCQVIELIVDLIIACMHCVTQAC